MRVMVVDDDADVLSVVGRALAADGHVVVPADSVAATRALLATQEPHLLVLDLALPDGGGLELCRQIRADGYAFPILILTARSDVAARVHGLDGGADDYLAKPFAVAELRARVRALGRRATAGLVGTTRAARVLRGDLVLDFGARQATRSDVAVPVTPREWVILEILASHRGDVVPRSMLLEHAWGEATEAAGKSLEVLVARLRKRLGAGVVRTIRGEGYAFGAET
ncbi:MAG: response regulator transcription factor [Labilithrix sp.]|nr:response regulator transcription factor [Labilithrix sp.]MCW5817422.1 response regulator transcription factor [Labilithrix sp.]